MHIIYDTQTGSIVGTLDCPKHLLKANTENLRENEAVLQLKQKTVDDIESHYVDLESLTVQPLPENPPENKESRELLRRQELAKITRDATVDSDIEVFGVDWQVDSAARDRMRSIIETAVRSNSPPEKTRAWILSDNSIRMTTAADLGEVLSAYSFRMESIFAQYKQWRDGSMTSPFTVE